jgi:hypothetical protein
LALEAKPIDPAVGLVQAYLRLNGFFTVTEYPVVATSPNGTRSLTDVDVLAVRFPNTQHWITGKGVSGMELGRDSELGVNHEAIHMLVGEVKEGTSKLNRRAYTPKVVESILRRFGGHSDHPKHMAQQLLDTGRAHTQIGEMPCVVDLVVFGGSPGDPEAVYRVIELKHVVKFMNEFARRYSDVFTSSQMKDDGFALMTLLAKLGIEL